VNDFLFTSKRQPQGLLSRFLAAVHLPDPPISDEFHGGWGSLAVVRNHYRGLAPYEDKGHMLAILGGPLVTLAGAPGPSKTLARAALTRFVLEAWRRYGSLHWERDLSGPFLVLRLDKKRNHLEIVTDPLSFLPLYHAVSPAPDRTTVLGSQPNLVAALAGSAADIDLESMADFIISSTGTYPYTLYRGVRQLPPGRVFQVEDGRLVSEDSLTYWLPFEEHRYESIEDAARTLRRSLMGNVERIAADLDQVGILLSGGEASRIILAALPRDVEKTAFTFADSLNREARTARAAARIYGARWVFGRRSPTHYLDHFEAASRLVGVQGQAINVHALGLHQTLGLHRYEAIFGGLWAETLFQDDCVPRRRRTVGRSLVLPTQVKELSIPKDFFYTDAQAVLPKATILIDHRLFKPRFVEAVIARRREHYERVKRFRPASATEWMQLWPFTHLAGSGSLLGHSRLFRDYEPFMSADLIRLAACIPQAWKLNRRLFQKAFRPLLLRSWYLPDSGKGRLPAFGLWTNLAPTALIQQYRKWERVVRTRARGHQGPWPEWSTLLKSDLMQGRLEELAPYFEHLAPMFNNLSYTDLFDDRRFSVRHQFKFYQLLRLFKETVG
jgi:hypothetical protein